MGYRSVETRSNLNEVNWLSLIAGGALVAAGIGQRSSFGGMLAGVGGALVFHGVSRTGDEGRDRKPAYARGIHVHSTTTVNRSPEQCYRFWRDLASLPRFLEHIQEVRVISTHRSHWVARTAGDRSIEWDAEITRDKPDRLIGWRSMPGSDIDTAGAVRFEPYGPGRTHVTVSLKYNPPAGVLGAVLLRVIGNAPEQWIAGELRRFKAVMEKPEPVFAQPVEPFDRVDESSDESFPASDPPSWTPSHV